MRTGKILFLLLGVCLFGCSGGDGPDDPCDGVDCSGHGKCNMVEGQARCTCAYCYTVSEDGKECLPDDAVECLCVSYTCSAHGQCKTDDDDQPYCDCYQGFHQSPDGLDCLEDECQEDCGPIGCCGTECCHMVPSNYEVLGELEQTGNNMTISGAFSTSDDCIADSMLGNCQLVELGSSPDVCVCRLDSLTVNGTLTVTGEPALAVLAWDSITIGGTLDISASGSSSGPGAEIQTQAVTSWLGGRGGTFGTLGGSSGAPLRGSEKMIPLMGGQSGQNGCGDRLAGGAGGAVQLTALNSIVVNGLIDASGGGGQGGAAGDHPDKCVGAAGGGSGGGILLEAPSVTMAGQIWAHGGGGGGGGNNRGSAGGNGQDATCSMTPAPGGAGRDGASCALYEAIEGGDGGPGSVGDQRGSDGEAYDQNMCDPDQPFVGGGGGGGGSGRIRINTVDPCDCSGTFSPSHTVGFVQGG